MAVAATFLTISATSAMAQSDPARKSAAELAIEAAVPMPEPANVPPPTAADFKTDSVGSTASVSDPAKPGDAKPAEIKADTKATDTKTTDTKAPETKAPETKAPEMKAADTKPADIKTPDTKPSDLATAPATPDAATTTAAPAAAPVAEPAKEPVKAASNVPPADQPVADKLRDMFAGKTLRTFDRKADRAAVEKFYGAREYAPI